MARACIRAGTPVDGLRAFLARRARHERTDESAGGARGAACCPRRGRRLPRGDARVRRARGRSAMGRRARVRRAARRGRRCRSDRSVPGRAAYGGRRRLGARRPPGARGAGEQRPLATDRRRGGGRRPRRRAGARTGGRRPRPTRRGGPASPDGASRSRWRTRRRAERVWRPRRASAPNARRRAVLGDEGACRAAAGRGAVVRARAHVPLPSEVARARDVPFVGRTVELTRLDGLLGVVADRGVRRLALLSGEPGIGKTRLALRFAAEPGRAATVLLGRCSEEPLTAYGPFSEILAHCDDALGATGGRRARRRQRFRARSAARPCRRHRAGPRRPRAGLRRRSTRSCARLPSRCC